MRRMRDTRAEAAMLAALISIAAACASTPERRRREIAVDLRQAQLLLRVRDDPYVMRQIQPVDEAIEVTIRELEGIESGQISSDSLGIDIRLSRLERFRRAMALLVSARRKSAGRGQAASRHMEEGIAALRQASAALGIGLADNSR